jgi:hypothetical protein
VTPEREGLLVIQAARRYKARCWWAEEDDLLQEAREAVLLAKRTFDPEVGVPLAAYAWRVAMIRLRAWLLRNTSPVSASAGSLHRLKDYQRASFDELAAAVYDMHDVESGIDAQRLHERVRHRVRTVENGHLADQVLLRGEHSASVARKEHVPVKHVYRACTAARRAIWNDFDIWFGWKEQQK